MTGGVRLKEKLALTKAILTVQSLLLFFPKTVKSKYPSALNTLSFAYLFELN